MTKLNLNPAACECDKDVAEANNGAATGAIR
jgi:hypothetical protein